MTDRRRRPARTQRTTRIQILLTREEAARIVEAARREVEGNVNALVRRAVSEYLERRVTA